MKDPTSAWQIEEADFPRAGTLPEKLGFMLRYAILAPSSHNTQPWLFRVRETGIDLFADWRRGLPFTDPTHRELLASCGAALHTLRVALRHFGYSDRVELFPDAADPDLVARVEVGDAPRGSGGDRSEFDAIARRRTDRTRYADRPVPAAVLSTCISAAHEHGAWLHVLGSDEERAALAAAVTEADQIQLASEEFRRELATWLHPNRAATGDGMPAYAFGVGNLFSVAAPLVVRRFRFGAGKVAADREIALGSPVLAVLGTAEDGLPHRVHAGEALSAVLLCACAEGVSVSYLNQVLEVPEIRAEFPPKLGLEGYPQIVLRMGYGEGTPPTPRRALAEFLLAGDAMAAGDA